MTERVHRLLALNGFWMSGLYEAIHSLFSLNTLPQIEREERGIQQEVPIDLEVLQDGPVSSIDLKENFPTTMSNRR